MRREVARRVHPAPDAARLEAAMADVECLARRGRHADVEARVRQAETEAGPMGCGEDVLRGAGCPRCQRAAELLRQLQLHAFRARLAEYPGPANHPTPPPGGTHR